MNVTATTQAFPRRIDIKQFLERSNVVAQTKRKTGNGTQKRNTATRVEGGTGVAVWKNLAVDDSVKQLSTTAVTLTGMGHAGNKLSQFQLVIFGVRRRSFHM